MRTASPLLVVSSMIVFIVLALMLLVPPLVIYQHKAVARWDGAVIVKICDGYVVYRLKDGTYVTPRLLTPVENPDTVCGTIVEKR